MERKSSHFLGRWVRKFLKKGGNSEKDNSCDDDGFCYIAHHVIYLVWSR
jgi:hypothetical protein